MRVGTQDPLERVYPVWQVVAAVDEQVAACARQAVQTLSVRCEISHLIAKDYRRKPTGAVEILICGAIGGSESSLAGAVDEGEAALAGRSA